MKSGDAVMLAALELIDPADVGVDLCWIFYDAEEGPYDGSGLGPLFEAVDWVRDIDLAFCLEPSDNVVQVGCVGSLHAAVTVRGRSCHSARPWQGENAIHKAGELLVRLAALEPKAVVAGGHTFHEVISATVATAGRARNVVPEACTFNVNYRFAPGTSSAQAFAHLRELVGDLADVEELDTCPSGVVVEDSPLFDRFLAASGAEVTAKQAWTDVARFAEIGVDAVNWGPGLSRQAYQAGEYAEIGLIVESFEMLRRFLVGS